MKKTLLAVLSLLLLSGLSFQSQAASSSSNQGSKASQAGTQGTAQGSQNGNAVQTEEKNKTQNQGENTQIQTNEKNTVQTKDNVQDKSNQGNSNSNSNSSSKPISSDQKGSGVANAVQAMLQIADRNGGIGQQVKTIAQAQTQNQAKLEANLEKVQSRSGFAKFLVGPNFGEIKDAQKTMAQNKEQIRQLNQLRTQLSNEGDQLQLTEQIKTLEQANLNIENSLQKAQGGFSLFGWLNKLIS